GLVRIGRRATTALAPTPATTASGGLVVGLAGGARVLLTGRGGALACPGVSGLLGGLNPVNCNNVLPAVRLGATATEARSPAATAAARAFGLTITWLGLVIGRSLVLLRAGRGGRSGCGGLGRGGRRRLEDHLGWLEGGGRHP